MWRRAPDNRFSWQIRQRNTNFPMFHVKHQIYDKR